MPRAVSSPDRRRTLSRLFRNQPGPEHWSHEACLRFGSPWLELVLRAGASRDAAATTCTRSELNLIDEATQRVWSLADQAQAEHRQTDGTPVTASRLAEAHRELSSIVVELEAMVAAAARPLTTAVLRDRSDDVLDRLMALRLATAELDRMDRPAAT
jgi:hypothetical protein